MKNANQRKKRKEIDLHLKRSIKDSFHKTKEKKHIVGNV